MKARVQKWGNSLAVRIPKPFADEMGIGDNAPVEMSLEEGALVIKADRERAARRPGVVLSPLAYNARVGLAVLCPITTQVKGYPFEVLIPPGLPVEGAVLADRVE